MKSLIKMMKLYVRTVTRERKEKKPQKSKTTNQNPQMSKTAIANQRFWWDNFFG